MELLGKRAPVRQSSFDINLLPLNLSDGRNIGDLSGLYLFNAPKKAESSRQSDILIILFHTDNVNIPDPRMRNWASILAENYFIARGSFTMGITSAVRKLSQFLEKETKGQIFPAIFMNAVVIRDRSLMIAHAGPVHSTVISSDHVQNFNNDSCLPIQLKNNELQFFTTEIHSEDIILLCPKVPNDWTNAAIMEVTGDSPLNAIRFLLDRSGGNLQAAVIQLKAGKGQISFRRKTSITADIQPGIREDGFGKGSGNASGGTAQPGINTAGSPAKSSKPLFRQRRSSELFNSEDFRENYFSEDTAEQEPVQEEDNDRGKSLTGEQELPGSEKLPYDFDSIEISPERTSDQDSLRYKVNLDDTNRKKSNSGSGKRKEKSGDKLNLKRFLMILACGILIPVIVVSVLFFIYSGRSKDQLHRDYLSLAVGTAQKALFENEDKKEQEALWSEVLDYTEKALSFSKSPAANDLKKEAMMQLDAINGGISTVYNYANQTKLPQGINITEIAGAGQFTYALDSTSGSVLRFSASGTGLALDSNFSCSPGSYTELGNKDNQIKVGALVDFILLPAGNPHNFVLAGVDKDANMLFCSAFTANQAESLPKPTGRFDIKAITYSNNAMYVLDAQASAVWEYLYSSGDGFVYEPSNYYGSYSPFLSDVIDFTMFKEYSFFLRENGTLLYCDYTGYRPDCKNITDLKNADGTAQIDLSKHHFKKILVNSSPDNSVYIMDSKLQTVLNLSVKANYVRYIVPNRALEGISQYSDATGFGIAGGNRLLWGYKNDLYIGNMP